MSKPHAPYAPGYRRQMVELVHAGRTPGVLAREYECSAQAIRNWVRQTDRDAGLAGVSRRRGVRATCADSSHRAIPDRVERHFQAETPNRIWVADITYVPTWAGFLYLSVVLDVFSRRVIGWSMANHLRTELVLNALNMALAQRRPEQVIHHSDRGRSTHLTRLWQTMSGDGGDSLDRVGRRRL